MITVLTDDTYIKTRITKLFVTFKIQEQNPHEKAIQRSENFKGLLHVVWHVSLE
jgi:hypothetical protein